MKAARPGNAATGSTSGAQTRSGRLRVAIPNADRRSSDRLNRAGFAGGSAGWNSGRDGLCHLDDVEHVVRYQVFEDWITHTQDISGALYLVARRAPVPRQQARRGDARGRWGACRPAPDPMPAEPAWRRDRLDHPTCAGVRGGRPRPDPARENGSAGGSACEMYLARAAQAIEAGQCSTVVVSYGFIRLMLLVEAVRRLRHEAGERQVPDAEVSLTAPAASCPRTPPSCSDATGERPDACARGPGRRGHRRLVRGDP